MPTTVVDGIATRYEVSGAGPPLLMFSPGGFDATVDSWAAVGIYRRLRLLEALSDRYTCITFDRREAGRSGGRLERIGWHHYAAQGRGLLRHLGLDRVHLLGACVGCSTALALAVAHPTMVDSLVLYSPAGGATYRMRQHVRFARHLAYVEERGLAEVVSLAASHPAGFSEDPRVGPWAPVLRTDTAFARAYATVDQADYMIMVGGMARLLFDRDTVPGAEPEDLMRLEVPALVVPGQDSSHATSAARYLQECLPRAQYWDAAVQDQDAETAPRRVLAFLDGVGSGTLS